MQEFEIESDRSLLLSASDRLGRKPFVVQLANRIVSYKQLDSIVMGLMGDWGSGKTSLLNFTKEQLNEYPPEQRPIVFDFNPWLFANHEDLISLFLKELSIQLKKFDYEKLAENLNEFSELFEATGVKFPILSWAVKFLGKKSQKSLLEKKAEVNNILKSLNELSSYLMILTD